MEFYIENGKIKDWFTASQSFYLTERIVSKYPDRPWEITNFRFLNTASYKFLETWLPRMRYCLVYISNPNLTLSLIEKNWKLFSQQISNISRHCSITPEFVAMTPFLNWQFGDRSGFVANPNFYTSELIRKKVPKRDTHDVYYKTLSLNPNATWDFILENLDKPWDWDVLSSRSDTTEEFILSHPEVEWKIIHFLRNPNISDEFIAKYAAEHYTESFDDWLCMGNVEPSRCSLIPGGESMLEYYRSNNGIRYENEEDELYGLEHGVLQSD